MYLSISMLVHLRVCTIIRGTESYELSETRKINTFIGIITPQTKRTLLEHKLSMLGIHKTRTWEITSFLNKHTFLAPDFCSFTF